MKPISKFKCGECGFKYADEEDAYSYCQPQVIEIFLCGECGKNCGDDKEAAEKCCADVDQEAQPKPCRTDLEEAGQQRLFG